MGGAWGVGAGGRRGRGLGGPGSRKGPLRQRWWVGVSRWPWESAGRASNCARSGWHGLVPRRRAAARPPLVRCGRVRTPPQPGLTPPPPAPPAALGAGDPRGQRRGREPCCSSLGEAGEPPRFQALLIQARAVCPGERPAQPHPRGPVQPGTRPPTCSTLRKGAGGSPINCVSPHQTWGQDWEVPRPGWGAPRGANSQETQKQAEQLQGH